jgi:hypothetical protein
MTADKLPVANFMTIELQARNFGHDGLKQRLALEKGQAGRVAAIKMQKVEGVKDQAHAARAVGRGLGLSEVWKAVIADVAQFAVDIRSPLARPRAPKERLGYLALQSRPVRVRSFALPRSIRTDIRKPSSLISYSHCGPDGAVSTSWVS